MKKVNILVVVILLIIACLNAFLFYLPQEASAFADGDGSAGNPYQISNVTELQNMSADLSANYILINDIDASNTSTWNDGLGFSPIANDTLPGTPGFQGIQFTGSFDGMGYKIINLTINRSGEEYVGLFGYVNTGATITNATLENVNVTAFDYVGGLIGYKDSAPISNCNITGYVNGSTRVGGLIGSNTGGTINNCSSDIYVNGLGNNNGGLIAYSSGSTITNCSTYGTTFGGNLYTGGLIGYNSGGTLKQCYSYGFTNTTGMYGGGLLGYNTNGGEVIDCHFHGTMYSDDFDTGGLIGYNLASVINCTSIGNTTSLGNQVGGLAGDNGGTITNCKAYGEVIGSISMGGLLGRNDGGTTSNCYSYQNITGTWNTGGLVGYISGGTIKNCTAYGNVSGSGSRIGGLNGYYTSGTIIDCIAYGNVSGSDDVGGLVGYQNGGTIKRCEAYGYVNATGNRVGGLCGEKRFGLVTQCVAKGDVKGGSNTAGLIGYTENSWTTWSIAYGNVTGSSYVGGLIGNILSEGTDTRIKHCTAYGNVTGGSYVGGLIARNEQGILVINCTANGDATGTGNYVGGLIGLQEGITENCTAYGDATGVTYVGGLIGYNTKTFGPGGKLFNCTAIGDVTGTGDYVGGLNGYNYAETINCTAVGGVSGVNRVGGLFGHNSYFNITNSYNMGYVNGTGEYIGGLVGYNDNINVTDCFVIGNVTGTGQHVGGLIGWNSANIMNCTTERDVDGSNRYVGGLIGTNSDGNITNCTVYGNITGTSDQVGGLIGYNGGDVTISNCYSTGNTTGSGNDIGGLIGNNTGSGNVTNCYSQSKTSGDNNVGGLIGRNDGATVTNCYSSGYVNGNTNVGGLIGLNSSGTVTTCFWDNQTSNQTYDTGSGNISGITGKNTNDMMTQDTFTGWDFVNIWAIKENYTYPFFVWDYWNDRPIANDDTVTTTEDTVLNIPAAGVLGNDTDPDTSDTLTVIAYDNPSTLGAVVTVNANGSYSYDPTGSAIFQALAVNEFLLDTFNYTVSDGKGGTDNATVNINVTGINDEPTVNNETETIDENTVLNIAAPGVLANDTDIDTSDTLTVIVYDDPSKLGADVTMNVDGSYTYDPTGAPALQALAVDEWVLDTFNYTISDGNGGTDNATVTINVTGVNDGPIANNDNWTTDEDTVLNIVAPGVLANDTDIDTTDTLTVIAYDDPSKLGAEITMNADGSYAYDPSGFPGFQALAVGEWILDTVNYTISDGNGETDNATVTVNVTGVNDDPSAEDDFKTTDEDSVLVVELPGVLINDTDVDTTDILTVIGFEAVSKMGAMVMVNAEGNFGYDPTTSTTLQALGVGEWMLDTFNYTISDGHGGTDNATVTIKVTGVNDKPLTNKDLATVMEDSGVNAINVLTNDIDIDGDILYITYVTQPAHGTVVITGDGTGLTYKPDKDYFGFDEFTYNISDGYGGIDTAMVNITVTNINDDPKMITVDVLTATEKVLYNVNYDATDVDPTYTFTWTLKTDANWLGINKTTGILSGTPMNPDVGKYWVNVTVKDGTGGSGWHNFTLTVENVNNAPEISTADVTNATEGALYNVTYEASDIDPTDDNLTWHISTDAAWLEINKSTGFLSGTPTYDDVGIFWVNVTVSDGHDGFDSSNFTLIVTETTPKSFTIIIGPVLYEDDSPAANLMITLTLTTRSDHTAITNETGYATFADVKPGIYAGVIDGPRESVDFTLTLSPTGDPDYTLPRIRKPYSGGPGDDDDGDGINNSRELELGTDPNNPDSDGDGVSDGVELAKGSDPLNGTDFPDEKKKGEEQGLSSGILIGIIIAIIVVLVILFLLMRKREPQEETETEEKKEEEKEEKVPSISYKTFPQSKPEAPKVQESNIKAMITGKIEAEKKKEDDDDEFECPDCGVDIKADATVCPKCGTEFEDD